MIDPESAPTSDKGLIESAVQYPQAFWKWGGRMTRKQYAIAIGLLPVSLMILFLTLDATKASRNTWIVAMVSFLIGVFFVHVWAAVRRFHDIGQPAILWVSLMTVGAIMGVGLLFVIFLLFCPGKPAGATKWG